MTPLEPMSARDVAQLAARHPYWRGRWSYLRHVAKLVRELAPRSVLEIGPGSHPFVEGSSTLDVDARVAPTFLHDAGAAPWPIESGSHELVLGLQCWEHLGPRQGGRQRIAFREARRVAGPNGHVLLSFPFRWEDTNAIHRGIDEDVIAAWTCDVAPERVIHVRSVPTRQRRIGLWRGAEERSG